MAPAAEPDDPSSTRLDSWKDVAAYLKRDVSTVQRWERREGLPIHRHHHDKLGSVYAYRHELDAWLRGRAPQDREPDVPGADAAVVTRRWPTARVAIVGCVAGLTVAVALFVALRVRSTDAAPRIGSLVVLPLSNFSGDPGQDYLAAGLTEELTGRLARLRALRVVSRTSAAALRDRGASVGDIARALDVDAVLEGSLRREADRIKVSVQLIHAPTDTHLWARDFERDVGSLLALQADVARAVVDVIRVQATDRERAGLAFVAPVSAAALDEYLLGRHLLWTFIDEDRERAIAHFNRAIQLQPDYAAPYAGLAHAWWMRGVIGSLSMREVAAPARDAAERALARDAGLAEAWAAKAYVQGVFDWDWTGAETTIRRALDAGPNSMEVRYVYALLLMAMGRMDESVEQIEAAASLDPLSAQVQSTFGRVLYRARRYEEAVRRLERAIELEPRNAGIHVRMGDVYVQMGRCDDARAAFERARALGQEMSETASGLARALLCLGREREVRQQSGDLGARVYAALGDADQAFARLFEAVERRDDWFIFIRSDPAFDRLHGDARWGELLRRMNLPAD